MKYSGCSTLFFLHRGHTILFLGSEKTNHGLLFSTQSCRSTLFSDLSVFIFTITDMKMEPFPRAERYDVD